MGEIPCRFPASREFPALETSSLVTVSSSGESANHQFRAPLSGITWHDGKPFTAKDVKCTWDLLTGQLSD